MRILKLLVISFWGILLISCQNEDVNFYDEQPPNQTDLAGDDIMVSSDIARQVGTMFRKNGGENSKLKSTNAAIKDISTVYNEDGTPAMYVINYENDEGFVVVSATRNYYPVLAFSEKGSFDPYSRDMPAGVIEWVDEGKQIIGHQIGEQCMDSLQQFREMWKMYETPNLKVHYKSDKTNAGKLKSYEYPTCEYYETFNSAVTQLVERWAREGTRYEQFDPNNSDIPEEIRNIIIGGTMDYEPSIAFILTEYEADDERTGPLLTTKWSQGYPYNLHTPHNYPSGCVATAMAQVMRYHQWPSWYNWSIMEDNYRINSHLISQESKEAVAELMYAAGRSISTDYGKDGSGANTSDAAFALHLNFGYSPYAKYSDYDFSTTVRNIQARRPVIMNGKHDRSLGFILTNGHAWVCDGYWWVYSKKKTTIVTVIGAFSPVEARFRPMSDWEYEYSTSWLHMNWGWNGDCDAWFSADNIGITNINGEYRNFKYGRGMITNIYPNR